MKELCLVSLENLAQKMPNEGLFASEYMNGLSKLDTKKCFHD